jgi:hypothetical protein
MAYMSQENKKRIVELAKPILKKYGVKATFAVRHHSTLVCNIKSGKIDFIKDCVAQCDSDRGFHFDVNPYWYHNHFEGRARQFLIELFAVLNDGNHDNSDAQVDYFDVGWYVDVNVGKWNKPYDVEGSE